MKTAAASINGAASTNKIEAQTMSKARLMPVRHEPWLKPSPKISQLALR